MGLCKYKTASSQAARSDIPLPHSRILHLAMSSKTVSYARQDDLARNVTLEQGKTLGDARGDVFRGLGAAPHASIKAICDLYSFAASSWCWLSNSMLGALLVGQGACRRRRT